MFLQMSVCLQGGWYPSMPCRWYPSMPCSRSPGRGVVSQHALQQVSRQGGVVSQHALQVSSPYPRGKFRGIWPRGGGLQAHTQGGSWGRSGPGPQPRGKLRGIWSRPTARGVPAPGGCACSRGCLFSGCLFTGGCLLMGGGDPPASKWLLLWMDLKCRVNCTIVNFYLIFYYVSEICVNKNSSSMCTIRCSDHWGGGYLLQDRVCYRGSARGIGGLLRSVGGVCSEVVGLLGVGGSAQG